MMKIAFVLKKVLKTFIWMVITVVLLFLIIAGLIRIPSVQTKIIHYAANLVSNKTHTKVEIKSVSISFPKSVVAEGIYLEDIKNDTLLYAGKAKINIALYNLFSSKIVVNSFALEDATLKLQSTKTDPLFNYNFLITAFADSVKQAEVDSPTPSKWTFSIDQIKLKNVLFTYNDVYGGMNVFTAIKKSDIRVMEIAPEKSLYAFNELLLNGLTIDVQRINTPNTQTKNKEIILPKVSAKNLQINNSSVTYTDSGNYMSVISIIDQIGLADASIDIQQELLVFDRLTVAKSDIRYHNFEPKFISGTLTPDSLSSSGNNWKVTVNSMNLADNKFIYQVGDVADAKNEFNPEYLEFERLTFDANDFYYDKNLVKIAVEEFSAIDQNGFVINKMETNFSMDETSITADKLKLKTPYSNIDADFYIQYSSIESFTQHYEFSNLNLIMRNVNFKNPNALYFSNDLSKLPFFTNLTNTTTLSGTVSGPLNNLTGRDLFVRTGENTELETDFIIAGLPNVKEASYNFSNLKISSGKKDIEMLAGNYIPKNIKLPENINVQTVFNGQLKSFASTVKMISSFGDANLTASIDPDENFSSNITLTNFDLGKVLQDTAMYGPVSLTAETSGQGLDLKTMKAKIEAEVTMLFLNSYTYHNLNLKGTLSEQLVEGKINLKDENVVFDMEATANLNPGHEQFQFRLNLTGADLQKLHFSKTDFRIGMFATGDFKGKSVDNLNGKAKITNLVFAHDAEKYALDSVVFTSVNGPDKSEFNISGDLAEVKYSGGVSPFSLPAGLGQFINQYFQFFDSVSLNKINPLQDFNFKIQLHNHPILSEVIFPELFEFQPGIIQGSFDSLKNNLKLNATIDKMVYGSTELNDFMIDVNSDSKALNYQISSRNISNSQASLEHFLMDGNLADNKMSTTVSSLDEKKNKKLLLSTQIIRDNARYKLTFDPTDFFMMYEKWNIASDNYIEFGEQGFLIHHLFMNNEESQVTIASVNNEFNDDIRIGIINFEIGDIAGIATKDSGLVKGTVVGNVLLKRVNNSYGLIADAEIMNLVFSNIPIGNLTVKAENPTTEKFNVEVNLSGEKNNLTADGYFIPNGGDQSILFNAVIQSLSLQTVQAFSIGKITKASGNLTGNFRVEGNTSLPEITGELVFKNAIITPAFLNNPLEIKNETFQLKKDGIYFDSFTITDKEQNTAILDGSVKMKQFSDFKFDLTINTKDFLLFNTSSDDNKEFFGRMIIDSKIDVTGPMSLPVVNAKLKLKKGSNFTFAVPEGKLVTDKGEDVVEFETGIKLNSILYREEIKEIQKSRLTGFDISSILEIDKEATLRLLMDPSSADSLVVRGDAALSFTIDRSGKISLAGAYNLNDGSYMASLESLIKRKFDIDRGSTIIWNGDPYDVEISINARYPVRASPIDLMADQMSGLSVTDQNSYKQRYPFWVLLKLRGKILQPEISFEIQLPPDEKGILSGTVNQKLSMLNEDESALNKQVFALLVLGRFIQENPLQTEYGGTSTLVRATVGKFLSHQLNQWSSKVLPGVDLNFDIQSYNDYQTGEMQGRTQVDIGLKKQLFGERLIIELGGTVDVEGERARQNSASNITSDVDIEYRLTKDGRYRLKGFRHNQYEGVIEGQLVETGAGIIYTRDFNKWKEFLKSVKKEKSDTLKNEER